MRRLLIGLLATAAWAAVTNVAVVRTTATQAIISYTAPTSATCTMEVSESATYAPVAWDVDASKFTGADTDSRAVNRTFGQQRWFVIGKRVVEKALDGKYYSRALKAATTYYYRINCGDTATGTFFTTAIRYGENRGFDFPFDATRTDGAYTYPTLDWESRTEKVIDHHTGSEIVKISLPNDLYENIEGSGACTGTNWTSPGYCQTDDALIATYTGTTRDMLFIPRSASGWDSTPANYSLARANLDMKADILGGPTGDDKYADICLTLDGATCATGTRAVDLTTCSTTVIQGGCSNLGSTVDMDFWGAVYATNPWVSQTGAGYLLKPRTISALYTLEIQYAKSKVKAALRPYNPTEGFTPYCSHIPLTDNGDGHTYYLCTNPGNFYQQVYAIDLTDARAYYLGPFHTGSYRLSSLRFDTSNGRVFYGYYPTNGRVYKGTWSSAPGALSTEWTSGPKAKPTNLTVTAMAGGATVKSLLAAYDARYTTEWQTEGTNVTLKFVQAGRLIFEFLQAQDAGAFFGVFDAATEAMVGSWEPVRCAGSRYCTNHSTYGGDQRDTVMMMGAGRYQSTGNWYGGPWKVKVRKPGGGDIGPTDNVFEMVLNNGSYQPSDSAPGGVEDALIPVQANDWVMYHPTGLNEPDTSAEIMEIVSIDLVSSPPRWTVKRGAAMNTSVYIAGTGTTYQGATGSTIPDSGTLTMVCHGRSIMATRGVLYQGRVYWDFAASPDGTGITYPAWSSGPKIIKRDNLDHHDFRGYTYISILGAITPYPCRTPNSGEVYSYTPELPMVRYSGLNTTGWKCITQMPGFAGIGPTYIGDGWGTHPSFQQVNAAGTAAAFAVDGSPFYGNGGGSSYALQDGTTQVYKVNGASVRDQKRLPVKGVCGIKGLRDISSPATGNQITDAKPYTFCVATKANECRTGATANDVYVSCPINQSACGSTWGLYGAGTSVDACIVSAPATSMGVQQIQLERPAMHGEANRLLTLAFAHMKTQSVYFTARALPDGDWVFFYAERPEYRGLYMVRAGPFDARTPPSWSFDRLRHRIGSVPNGTNNVVIEFGYTEHGEATDYYCTSRAEVCVVTAATIVDTNPFTWAADVAGGVACAPSCTVEIPRIPGRVIYARVKYRDAGGTVLHTETLSPM